MVAGFPRMRDPRDQGTSSNAIHDLVSEIITCHLHGAPLATKTSPESVWEERPWEHKYQEVRTVGAVLEASDCEVPYQRVASCNRYPVASVPGYPRPSPSNNLGIFHKSLPFLWYSASLFQIKFTNFLPLPPK